VYLLLQASLDVYRRVGTDDHECGVCLSNSVFKSVLGVGITATKFASEVVKLCCDCVCVEDRVSELKVYQLSPLRLLQEERRLGCLFAFFPFFIPFRFIFLGRSFVLTLFIFKFISVQVSFISESDWGPHPSDARPYLM